MFGGKQSKVVCNMAWTGVQQTCCGCLKKYFVYDKFFLRVATPHTSGLTKRELQSNGKITSAKDEKEEKKIVRKPGFLRKYVAEKYLNVLQHWEKKHPPTYRVFAMSTAGVKSLLSDMGVYTIAVIELYNMRKGMVDYNTLTRNQLLAYRQVPRDLKRVGVLLLLSTIPFVGNLFFLVAYKFPKHLLSRQFWTPEQKKEFDESKHNLRVDHFPKLLAKLKVLAAKIKDVEEKKKLLDILNKVPDGIVSVEELLTVKHLFEQEPLSLWSLNQAHIIQVSHVMDMPKGKQKLIQDVMLLHSIDNVIHREGIHTLNNEELHQACFDRGINSYVLTKEEQVKYLESWLQLSVPCSGPSLSLMLHGPLFLAWRPSQSSLQSNK